MSEDLSEGEKGDVVGDISAHGDSNRSRMPRINLTDVMDSMSNMFKEKKLYIMLISLHGLIRGENMELGRDSDTGGQVKYVMELARALGMMPGVYRIDLLARQVYAPGVQAAYWGMLEEGRISQNTANIMMQVVDGAMDLVSHKTLCDWNGLKAHVHFPRLESACYICAAFLRAHRIARR